MAAHELQYNQTSNHPNLLGTLARRDMSQRFSQEECIELASLVQAAWQDREPPSQSAIDLGFIPGGTPSVGDVSMAEYNIGEVYGLYPDIPIEASEVYFWANLEDLEHVAVASERANVLKSQGVSRADLMVTNMGYQRAERAALRGNGMRELRMLDFVIGGLAGPFDSVMTPDTHSPCTAFTSLEHGMPIMDVTAIPILLKEAKKNGYLSGELSIAVGDDGSLVLGKLVQTLIGDEAYLIAGKKTKVQGRTTVYFKPEELALVKGTTVIIPEDMVCSGGTILEDIRQLLEAGAEKVVILAPHGYFSPGAENLGHQDNVVVFVTNTERSNLSHRMKQTQTARQNIFIIDVSDNLHQLAQMDRDGTLRDYDNELIYEKTGLMLAPWQYEGT
jgi:phosphoribosylpyrophosphate synthetase